MFVDVRQNVWFIDPFLSPIFKMNLGLKMFAFVLSRKLLAKLGKNNENFREFVTNTRNKCTSFMKKKIGDMRFWQICKISICVRQEERIR
jgi:hypothetical protein